MVGKSLHYANAQKKTKRVYFIVDIRINAFSFSIYETKNCEDDVEKFFLYFSLEFQFLLIKLSRSLFPLLMKYN